MPRRASVLALPLVALLAGCDGGGKSAHITAYPRWEFQDYPRIAVVPVRTSDARADESARRATLRLEDLLANNGSFTVAARDALKDVLTEQDLSRLADVADPATMLPEHKVQIAQALIVAKITDFDLLRDRREIRIPRYARTRKGRIRRDRRGRPIVVGEDVIVEYMHGARVGGNVRVLDAATGVVLLSHTSEPIVAERIRRGAPPPVSPQELAVAAARELAVDFYRRIAPQRVKVKIGSDSLIVALDYYEGRYDKTKKVPTTLDEFLLVVRALPPAAERNEFRVEITPAEGRQVLFEQRFIWSGATGPRGLSFPVAVQPLLDSGEEKFVAKLYSAAADVPILKRKFKLEPPDENDKKAEEEDD